MSLDFTGRSALAGRPTYAARFVLLLTGLQAASAASALVLAIGYAAYQWNTEGASSCELDQVAAPLVFSCCAGVALVLAVRGRRAGAAIAAVLPGAAQAWMLLWRAPLYDWPNQVFLMPLGELTRRPYPTVMLATDLLAMLSVPLGVAAATVVVLAGSDAPGAGRDAGRVRRWMPGVVLLVLAVGVAGMYDLSFRIAELAEHEALLFVSGPTVRDKALAVAGAAVVAGLVELSGTLLKGRWSRWASGGAGAVLLVPAGWDVWDWTRELLTPRRLSATSSIHTFSPMDAWSEPFSEGLNMAAWQGTALVLALAALLGATNVFRAMRGPGAVRELGGVEEGA